jgi:choline-sulfatase
VPRPNLLLLITDQQRYPQHWPGGTFVRDLAPADAELARTGLTFTQAFVNSCMCSPSRATLLTGLLPAGHGVTLTHTDRGARPTPARLAGVIASALTADRRDGVPPLTGMRSMVRMAFRTVTGTLQRSEPELLPSTPNLATGLRAAGYHVAYKGKWHLTKPRDRSAGWTEADAAHIESTLGFAEWEPPDAGEDVEPEHFGGGVAGYSGAGWDEDYTRQAEAFLARPDRPEPFALVVSLVNPHDVLGYPGSYAAGGYRDQALEDLGVDLPPTFDEDLAGKPTAHGVMRHGQAGFLGALRTRAAQRAYVNFYAHLQRVVDEKVGRIVAALGDPGDPGSLRSRTVVVRTSDHGEMGLAHGGLRQKMFNAYEETLHVPLVVSNPVLFPRARETGALASLVDVMPTLLALAGAQPPAELHGADLTPVLAGCAEPDREAPGRAAVDLGAVLDHPAPQASIADAVPFTYDDDAAGTFLRDTVPPPNHIRCVREQRLKYATYIDPAGRAVPQHELYDLDRDPLELANLVDRDSGELRGRSYAADYERLRERVAAVPVPPVKAPR